MGCAVLISGSFVRVRVRQARVDEALEGARPLLAVGVRRGARLRLLTRVAPDPDEERAGGGAGELGAREGLVIAERDLAASECVADDVGGITDNGQSICRSQLLAGAV